MNESKKNNPTNKKYKESNGNDKPRRKRDGRERKVHEQIVARRLEGGAPATPEAYANALEQWQKLPGAVIKPATDVGILKNAELSHDGSGSEATSGKLKEEDEL